MKAQSLWHSQLESLSPSLSEMQLASESQQVPPALPSRAGQMSHLALGLEWQTRKQPVRASPSRAGQMSRLALEPEWRTRKYPVQPSTWHRVLGSVPERTSS